MAKNKTEANNTVRSTTIKSLQKTGRQAGSSNVCKSKGRQSTVRSTALRPGKITCQRGRGSASTERGTQRGIWPSAPGTGRRQDLRRQSRPLGRQGTHKLFWGQHHTPPRRPRSWRSVLLCATLNATPLHTRPQRLRPRRLPSTTSKYLAAGMAGSPSCLRAAPLFTFGEREVRAPIENPPYVRDDRGGMETPPC